MKQNQSSFQEIWHFIIHLRWHYQVFILSGGYLLGGCLSSSINWFDFILQFLNIHLLLFGGATAYNSYWDKDEGAVGGLRNPPPMSRWMWIASLVIQAAGLLLAFREGILFSGIYLLSIMLFWLYSTPHARWKGKPLLSLLAIGISTGTNTALMGYLAAGNAVLNMDILSAALGVAFIILSLYPVSQLYQMDEDLRRGDQTFAMKFGYVGVVYFFCTAFAGGLILVAAALEAIRFWLSVVFLAIGLATGSWVYMQLKKISAEKDDYAAVMQIKYRTSLAFVAFLVLILLLQHLGTEMF